ncbi:tyrosine phosphatase family protein [Kurthia sp. 11kri321]|uniref:tyrosine-protein phosphatase n=1 Tax=Kurthia sp. 11kri321 TaxID=1750719 RepID=UPI000745EC9B|nr:tyrosine-protein phosphatase [Kurthia sp. 11kri321]AMA62812.1 tyrosine phosphatase family protein [Kurthia sp. 11kri321]
MTYQFEGIYNFHDLGGLKSSDGRNVKKGLLFQSGDISNATVQDIYYLKEVLGIKTIIDYRNEYEQNEKPSLKIQGVHTIHSHVSMPTLMLTELLQDYEASTHYFEAQNRMRIYREHLAKNNSYRPLIEVIRLKQVPLLQHCMLGRDRTGIGVFLLYLLLDVPLKTIVQTFLERQKNAIEQMPEWLKVMIRNLQGQKLETDMNYVNGDFLLVAYDEILNEFDTIENFFLKQFQIDKTERKAIQDFYLE